MAEFDTGLDVPQRTIVRDGVVALLSPLLVANGGFLANIIKWGGVIRGYTDDEGISLLWQAFEGAAPAIAVTLGDAKSASAGMGGFNFVDELELIVYFYSQHAHDPRLTVGRLEQDAAAIANGALDPGLDWIKQRTKELLIGQKGGASSTVKQLVPTSEEEVRTISEFTLWMQRYTLKLSWLVNKDRTVTDVMTEFRTKLRTSDMDPDPAPPVVESQSLTNP